MILKVPLKENILVQRLKEYNVHVLELWNNNIKQLEDNMPKSDTSFRTAGRISLKK